MCFTALEVRRDLAEAGGWTSIRPPGLAPVNVSKYADNNEVQGKLKVENANDRPEMAEADSHEPADLKEEETFLDLVVLFHTLRQGKKTILAVSISVCAIVTLIAFLIPFRYTSTVSFIPPSTGSGSSMASMLAGQLSALGGEGLLGGVRSSGELYAGILNSRSVTGELVKRFDLTRVYGVRKESQAEDILRSNTKVSVDSKSSIETIEVTDKSPTLARDLAGAYMDALRETNGRLALTQSSQRRLFFEQQLAKEKDDLEDAEVDLKKTEEQSGLIAPAGQTETEIRTIAETQAQIAAREVQLAALRDSATEQNPEVIRLRSEIANLQGQLAGLQKGSGSASAASIPTSKVPEVELEYVRKEREVKYHEALFDILSKQYEAARLDEAQDSPVLQVLDAPSYPDTKSSPKRAYYVLGGLLLGLFAGLVWVLARDRVRALRVSYAAKDAV
jgi:tyrosine-protein kinase Etk/Wzc